jgi:glycosyltransferase involved in cell wall biosynthesis
MTARSRTRNTDNEDFVSPLVSICIPAWERPELLTQTLESCFAQTYRPLEVLVTDDSRTDAIQRVAEGFAHIPFLRYVRNEERLGQANNVNRLFELAAGDRLVLLHDDDTLLPQAVEIMDRAWREDASSLLCYGKSIVTTHDGTVVEGALARYDGFGELVKRRLARGAPPNLWYVLDGHFPSNGFLVRTEAARSTGYRDLPEIGDACDVDFALRIAGQRGAIRFVDAFVSTYRISEVSISTQSTSHGRSFFLIESLEVPEELEPARQKLLRRRLVGTVRQELLVGRHDVVDRLLRQYCGSWRTALRPVHLANRVLRYVPRPLLQATMRLKQGLRRRLRRGGWFYRLRAWKTRLFGAH